MKRELCITFKQLKDIKQRGDEKKMPEKFNPADVIGKSYKRGMLPYGGSVTRGKISSAISEEEYQETMKRLKSITA
jgi:hypothetical protein